MFYDKLIKIADNARKIPDLLGLRHYEVRIIITSWSGGERGHGVERIVNELLLSPTPRVDGWAIDLSSKSGAGAEETGYAFAHVSARYTEIELIPEANSRQDIFWEIEDRKAGIKRRFYPEMPATKEPGSTKRVIRLRRTQEDRNPSGFLPRA